MTDTTETEKTEGEYCPRCDKRTDEKGVTAGLITLKRCVGCGFVKSRRVNLS